MTNQLLTPAAIKALFAHLFQEESALILVVDQQNQNEVLEYRFEPLAEVVATLALNGLGNPQALEGLVGGVDHNVE